MNIHYNLFFLRSIIELNFIIRLLISLKLKKSFLPFRQIYLWKIFIACKYVQLQISLYYSEYFKGFNKKDWLEGSAFILIKMLSTRFYCDNCDVSYVSQTKRQLKTRLHEHVSDINGITKSPSVISNHRIEKGHNFKWDNVKILDF